MTLLCFLYFFFYACKGKNINVDENVNVMPTSKGQQRAHGRPQKRDVVQDIDQVIKELLSDLELSESKGEDLWYDNDEVKKEKDGTTHWWEKG